MSGMGRASGRQLTESEHIRQSIRDILTTPIGSRVMRRTYGSLIPSLIDQPGNAANCLRMTSAAVMAILTWEPRVSVSTALVDIGSDGTVALDLEAVRKDGQRSGSAVSLSIPLN